MLAAGDAMRTKIIVAILVLFLLAVVLSQVWSTPVYVDYTYMGYPISTHYGADDMVKFEHMVGAGDDRLLIVVVGIAFNELVTGVTWKDESGQSLTLAESRAGAAGMSHTEVWYLANPASGTDSINIDITGGHDGGSHAAFNFTNVNQTNPIGATADSSRGDAGIEPIVFLTTANDSSFVLTACTQHGVNTGPYTASSGQIEVYDTVPGATTSDAYAWGGYITRLSAGAQACSLDATGDDSDDDWGIVSVEIRHIPAGAYPSGTDIFFMSPDYERGGNRAGNDSYAGNHPDMAWATLDHACDVLEAGDILYVMGGIYDGDRQEQGVFYSPVTGSEGSPVTIKAYGDSTAVFTKTGRDGAHSNHVYFWLEEDNDWVTIDGFSYLDSSDSLMLKFQGGLEENQQFIAIFGTYANRLEGTVIKGIHLDGDSLVHYGIRGNFVQKDSILSNRITHIWHPTGNIVPGDSTDIAQGTGEAIILSTANRVIIKNNVFIQANHAIIQLGTVNDAYDEPSRYNKVIDNFMDCQWGGGLYFNSMAEYNLAEGNVITRVGQTTTKTKGALFLAGSHNVARGNVIYCPLSDAEGYPGSGATDRFNYPLSVQSWLAAGGHYCIADSNTVYNNTIYGCSPDNFRITISSNAGANGSVDENLVWNNIFYKAEGENPDADGNESEVNWYLFYATDAANWITPNVDCINPETDHFGGNKFLNNNIRHHAGASDDSLVCYTRDSDHNDGCASAFIYYDIDSLANVDASYIAGNIEVNPVFVSENPVAHGLNDGWWEIDGASECVDAGTLIVDTIGTYVNSIHAGWGWVDTLVWYGTAPDIGAYETGGAEDDTCCVVSHKNFNAIMIDSACVDSFYLYNCGDSALVGELTPSTWDTVFVLTSDSTYSISATTQKWFVLTFTPPALGGYADTICTGNTACDSVRLAGQGLGLMCCSVVDTLIAFGGDVDTGATKLDSFYVKNCGDSTLADNIQWDMNPVFTLQSDSSYNLSAGDSAWFIVQFAPLLITAYADTQDMGHSGCTDLVLTGTGSVADECCEVSNLDFSSTALGERDTLAFFIYNPGDSALVDSIDWAVDIAYTLLSDSIYSLDQGDTAWFNVEFMPMIVQQYPDTQDAGAAVCSDIIFAGYGWAPRTAPDATSAVFGPIIWQRAGGESGMRTAVLGSVTMGNLAAIPCETPVLSGPHVEEGDTSFMVLHFTTDINAAGQVRYIHYGEDDWRYTPAQPEGNTTNHACTITDATYGNVLERWSVRATYPGRLACSSAWTADSLYLTACGTDEVYLQPHYVSVEFELACFANWDTGELCDRSQSAWKTELGSWSYSSFGTHLDRTTHTSLLSGMYPLIPNKTYFWKVRNRDKCAVEWDYGPEWTFSTDDQGDINPESQ